MADFGIALAASRAGGTRMTETGMSLGTPHYMSPEQAMGEREITARSDIYALGAVTYEMLVGEPPFTGPTAQAIVAKVLTEEPRAADRPGGAPSRRRSRRRSSPRSRSSRPTGSARPMNSPSIAGGAKPTAGRPPSAYQPRKSPLLARRSARGGCGRSLLAGRGYFVGRHPSQPRSR